MGLGRAGERLASWFLASHGLSIQARNVPVSGGELDILAQDGTSQVVVEVRTVSGGDDPIDAIDEAKRRHVSQLARGVGAQRVDFVGILIDSAGVDIHWMPGSN